MSVDKEKDRELAYRYDLFVAPDWDERFNTILDEHVEMPKEGRVLEINCGTGTHAIAVSVALEDGDVVGTDPSAERVAIARAKSSAADAERVTFAVAEPEALDFEPGGFDAVVLDASLLVPERLGRATEEAVRVAAGGAPIAVKVQLRGSFDEFYSIYWEALHEEGIHETVWQRLEAMMTSRHTAAEALSLVRARGVRDAEAHVTREEWQFETGAAFLESPLMNDLFLDAAISIVPDDRREDVRAAIVRVVDREAEGGFFDVSAKAAVVAGRK